MMIDAVHGRGQRLLYCASQEMNVRLGRSVTKQYSSRKEEREKLIKNSKSLNLAKGSNLKKAERVGFSRYKKHNTK